MKKKIFALVISLILIINVYPCVNASVQTNILTNSSSLTINAMNYSNASREKMDNLNGMVYIYLQMFVEYPIRVDDAGLYTVKIYGEVSNSIARYATLNYYIDEEFAQVATVTQSKGGVLGETVYRAVEFPEGEHILKFKNVGGSGARIQKIVIEPTQTEEKTDGIFKKNYRNSYLPTRIQAEDFDRDGFKTEIPHELHNQYRVDSSIMMYRGQEEKQWYISLCEGEYTEYTFIAENSGNYDFYVKAAGFSRMKFTFDGSLKPFIKEIAEGENFVETLFVEKGVHTMRVETDNDSIGLDWFAFKSSKEQGIPFDKLSLVSDKKDKPQNPIYKEIYISPTGSDDADGSAKNPFKTLERAKEKISEINDDMTGDIIVNIASGIYKLEETFVLNEEHSGKNGYNVIFRGEDKENPPVISGGEQVLGWEKYSDVLYRAPMPEGVSEARNLYVNDYPAMRAKSKYQYNVKSFYDDPATQDYVRDGFLISDQNFLKSLLDDEDLEIVFNMIWSMPRYPIEKLEYVGDKILLHSDHVLMDKKRTTTFLAPQTGSAFHIENSFDLLDEPGEFYYNKKDGYIYYYPEKVDDMKTAKVFVGKVDGLVNIQGANPREKVTNVTFDNISFKYSAWNYVSKYGHIGRQADEFSSSENDRVMTKQHFEVNYADNINIQNCRFSCLGASAIGMLDGVSNSNVVGNAIHDVSGAGIVFGHWIYENWTEDPTLDYELSSNLRAENNAISRVCYEYPGSTAIAAYYVKGIKLLHNDISKLPYSAISVGWGWGEDDFDGFGSYKISYNKLSEAMENLIDGNHIYVLGCLDNCDISYNYALKTRTAAQVYGGVYFDAASCNSRAHHNLTTQASCWLMWSALNWIENNYAYASYADTEKFNYATGSGPQSLNIEPVTLVDSSDESTWNDEAKYIRDNAGLEQEYKHLLDIVKIPDGKSARIHSFPKNTFDAKSGDWIEAEDFLPGEDKGWHKESTKPKYNDNEYRPEEGVDLLKHAAFPTYVIEANGKGDWQKYEFEVPADGTYYMDISAAHGYQNDSLCNIYIDDVLVIENGAIKRAPEGWYVLNQSKLGSFELTAGKHIMKYEFVNSAYVDAFRIHDGSIYAKENAPLVDNNSPSYDEGVMEY